MPSWIKVEGNEETVSVLLTRWIEGGVHLSIMSQTYFYPDLFNASSYFVLQFPEIFKSWLMCEDGAFHFQAEGEVNFIFLCLFSTEFLLFAAAVR